MSTTTLTLTDGDRDTVEAALTALAFAGRRIVRNANGRPTYEFPNMRYVADFASRHGLGIDGGEFAADEENED